MEDNLLKCRGQVEVTQEVLMENPRPMMEILGQILIVDVVHNLMHKTTTYFGYSEHFDEIDEGEVVPKYSVEVEQNGDDMSVEFVRVK